MGSQETRVSLNALSYLTSAFSVCPHVAPTVVVPVPLCHSDYLHCRPRLDLPNGADTHFQGWPLRWLSPPQGKQANLHRQGRRARQPDWPSGTPQQKHFALVWAGSWHLAGNVVHRPSCWSRCTASQVPLTYWHRLTFRLAALVNPVPWDPGRIAAERGFCGGGRL